MKIGKQQSVKSGMFRLVNVRQRGTAPRDTAAGGARFVLVPVGDNVNGGSGVHFYLNKRDAGSGKPIFYTPEIWASMNDTQRKDALDLSPIADESHKAVAANLLGAFTAADPLAKKALVDELTPIIRAQVEAQIRAEVEAKKPSEKRS